MEIIYSPMIGGWVVIDRVIDIRKGKGGGRSGVHYTCMQGTEIMAGV